MNAVDRHGLRQVTGKNEHVPVSGEEQEGGQLVHHELPGQVIKTNVHPVKHTKHFVSSSLLQLILSGTGA